LFSEYGPSNRFSDVTEESNRTSTNAGLIDSKDSIGIVLGESVDRQNKVAYNEDNEMYDRNRL
jgi:hypothetical protein